MTRLRYPAALAAFPVYVWFCAGFLLFVLILAAMVGLRARQQAEDMAAERAHLAATAIMDMAGIAARTGFSRPALATLNAAVLSRAQNQPGVVAIEVTSAEGETLARAGNVAAIEALRTRTGGAPRAVNRGDPVWLATQWQGSANERLTVEVAYDPAVGAGQRVTGWQPDLINVLPPIILLFACGWLLLVQLAGRKRKPDWRYTLTTTALTGALIVMWMLGWFGQASLIYAEQAVAEQRQRHGEAVLQWLGERVERAAQRGVPVEQLTGVEEVLEAARERFPRISSLGMVTPAGRVITAGDPEPLSDYIRRSGTPQTGMWIEHQIVSGGRPVAKLVASYSSAIDRAKVLGLITDLLVAAFVALVLSNELMQTLASGRIAQRLHRARVRLFAFANAPATINLHDTTVARVRLALFLCVLAEEMNRPFLADFLTTIPAPVLGEQANAVLLALPMVVFMLMWGAAQILGPGIHASMNARTPFLLGGALQLVGMLWLVFTRDWQGLIAARAMSAVGYGLIIFQAQAVLLRPDSRMSTTRGLQAIAQSIVAAGVAGPLLGGIAADFLGYQQALAVCTLLAATALFAARRIPALPPITQLQPPTLRLAWQALRASGSARAILIGSAMPAKMAATAILLVLAPLTVIEHGHNASMAGKLVLLYFAAWYIVVEAMKRLPRNWLSEPRALSTALVLSLVACLAGGLLQDPIWGIGAATVLLGIAHAIQGPPLTTNFVTRIDQAAPGTKPTAIAILRLSERLGAAMGPLFAFLVLPLGIQKACFILGIVLALAAAAGWLYNRTSTNDAEPVRVGP